MHFLTFTTLLSLVCATIFASTHGQNLSAVHLDTRIPTRQAGAAPYYDGDDTILLFGGTSGPSFTSTIYKFQISSETFQLVGQMPGQGYLGSVQEDSEGNLYHFGGDGYFTTKEVCKINPFTYQSEVVTTLPNGIGQCNTHKVNSSSNEVIILGRSPSHGGIQVFNLKTLQLTSTGKFLPWTFQTMSSVTLDYKRKAYVFGAQNDARGVVEVDLDTFEAKGMPNGMPVFFGTTPATIYDDRSGSVFVLGGYLTLSGLPMTGMIRLNQDASEQGFVYIENYPIGPQDHYHTSPTAVLVQRLNRIYFFGGMSYFANGDYSYRDDVWYVDLSPLTLAQLKL